MHAASYHMQQDSTAEVFCQLTEVFCQPLSTCLLSVMQCWGSLISGGGAMEQGNKG